MYKQIPYGIRYGKRVTIDEIKSTERGNRCDCICEICKLPLVAVIDSLEMRPHFRHERGHNHCHFDRDEGMFNLIFDMIGKLDDNLLLQIIENGVSHFDVNGKNRPEIKKNDQTIKLSKPVIYRNEKKEIFLKFIIDGEEFQIRITTSKVISKETNNREQFVRIADLLASKDSITQQKIKEIIDEILFRAGIKISERYIQTKNEEIINHTTSKQHEEPKTNDVTKLKTIVNTDFNEVEVNDESLLTPKVPDFNFKKIYNGVCPDCKKGKVAERVNNTNGNPFFGCSNFPHCRYVHPEPRYYDEVLEDWIYHSRFK
jgi:hypothetical protein